MCVAVTIGVSVFTTPKQIAELQGLVYGVTGIPSGPRLPFHKRPLFLAALVALALLALNLYFW